MKTAVIKPTEFGPFKLEAYQTKVSDLPAWAPVKLSRDPMVIFGLMLRDANGICHFRWGITIKVDLLEGQNYFKLCFDSIDPFKARVALQIADAEGHVLPNSAIWEEAQIFPWVTVFPCVAIHGLIGQVEVRELVLENLGSDVVFIYFKPFWLGENRRSWQVACVKIPTMMWQANRLRFALLVDSNEPATSADLGFIPAGDVGSPILIFKTTWATASLGPVF